MAGNYNIYTIKRRLTFVIRNIYIIVSSKNNAMCISHRIPKCC